MAQLLILLIAELFGLFILSRRLTNQLFQTFLLVFHNRPVAVSAITALLFPGTVIHELSHLFTAEILGVKTGKLTLAPESISGERVNVGSVELSQTDPFRRSVIGLSPFFIGLIALFGLSSILPNLWMETVQAFQGEILFSSSSFYFLLLTGYVLFCVSNTMFTSPEDMKGVIPLTIVLILIGGAAYMAGFRVGITGSLADTVTSVLSAISKSISVVLLLNLFLYLTTSLILRLTKRLQGK